MRTIKKQMTSNSCGAATLLCAALELGRVDKLNPDADAGKQHEGGKALDELVVSGGNAA